VSSHERAHKSTSSLWWGEAWGFDFIAGGTGTAVSDATGDVLGGFVRLAVYPNQRACWFWAAIVGSKRTYVLCRDHDLDPPADTNVFEVRGGSLWSHAICETPLEHWTVAMEAYALAFDDPSEAWRSERGDRVGLAFDLEWESDARTARWIEADAGVTRYELPCEVNGTLQLGDEEWTIAGDGTRHHEWGQLDWLGPIARRGHSQLIVGTDLLAPDLPAPDLSVLDLSNSAVLVAPLLIDSADSAAKPALRLLRWIDSEGSTPAWSERIVD
jgi:hypothetical protein